MGLVVSPQANPATAPTPRSTGQSLGTMLQPNQTQIQPMTLPQPQGVPTDITGAPAQSQTQNKLMQAWQNPLTQAFILNTAANLLNSRGWGPSLAEGLKGMGRYQESQNAANDKRRAEELRMKAAGGKGGGSGGKGSTTTTTPIGGLDGLDMKAYQKRFDKLRGEIDDKPGTPEYDVALAEANIQAARESGLKNQAIFGGWDSLDDDQKKLVARKFATIEGALDITNEAISLQKNQGLTGNPPAGQPVAPTLDEAPGRGMGTVPVDTPQVPTTSVPSFGLAPQVFATPDQTVPLTGRDLRGSAPMKSVTDPYINPLLRN